jgi:phosphoglycerate dehydrogenase-like enzyme
MLDPSRVVITDFITEPDIERRVLGGAAEVECLGAHGTSDLRGRVARADVLICCHAVEITAEVLAEAVRCRGVIRAGVGYNNIDIRSAGELGMFVCNVPDYCTEEVADHALGLLLALARRLLEAVDSTRRGQWNVGINTGARRLRGQTLGIIGCGRIGSALAMRAKALGLRTVIYDPYLSRGLEKSLGVERVWSLEELLPQCQFLSLNCPLTEETRHIMDARTIGRLRRGAYLINTARGGLIDEPALLDALTNGQLGGAAIDVAQQEPLADERLWTHPRLLVTPHCAFYSVEAACELRTRAAQEALRLLRGEPPLNPVNREFLKVS